MLEHHRALAGLCAPTVNAYKRLKPAPAVGLLGATGATTTAVRRSAISPERGEGARLEHRLSDGAAPRATSRSPRSSRRACSASSERSTLGRLRAATASTSIEATVGTPSNLGEALDELESDTALVEAIGAELVAQHLAVKRTEWQRFCEAVTDWELREYLPFL